MWALCAYDDVRAVPALLPHVAAADEGARAAVLTALACLLTSASLEALRARGEAATLENERKLCERVVSAFLAQRGVTWDEYVAKPEAEKARWVAAYRDEHEARFRTSPEDRRLSREELASVLADWKGRGRTTGGEYAWVEGRHLLAVVEPRDIGPLREVRAALYRRQSVECLYEIRELNELLRRIGRQRY